MSLTATTYEHVALDEAEVPIITGTTMKVVELVLEQRAYGWSPEEMLYQHPYLTLGQIYSALAYYWDHQDALDADIEKRFEHVERLSKERSPTPFDIRLKQLGLR